MGDGKIEHVLMRQLASYLAVPILVVNRDLDLLFFNESAEPILGRRFDETGEIRRGEWNRLLQPTDEHGVPVPRMEQPLTRAILRQVPSYRRSWVRGLDGAPRRVEGVAFPMATREAGLVGAVGIFWELREVGERSAWSDGSALSRSRHDVEVILLRRLADRLLVPIFMEDAGGRLLFYNEAAEPLIGRPFSEVGHVELRDWIETFEPTDEHGVPIPADEHPLGVARLRQEPSFRRFVYRGLDGVRRRVEAIAFPLLGQCDRHLGAVAIFWEEGA